MELVKLSPALGAEVRGVDLNSGLSDALIEKVRQAFEEAHLLLFRGRAITVGAQLALCKAFGPLLDEKKNGLNWWTLTNREGFGGRGRLLFHSDNTYSRAPIVGISLYATEIPRAGTSTFFANALRAWSNLPEALQRSLAVRSSRHVNYFPTEEVAARTLTRPPFVQADHPIRYLHPRSGRPMLFVTELATQGIEGLSREESDALLDEAFRVLYAPENQYEHHWQLNDLLVWDNLALQHARQDSAAGEPRSFRRVTFSNDELFAASNEFSHNYYDSKLAITK